MAKPKTSGDQKLSEMVCCMLELKVTTFQVPRPNGFSAILKETAEGTPGPKTGLNFKKSHHIKKKTSSKVLK